MKKIVAEKRSLKKKNVKKLRRMGHIPGVIYGKEVGSLPIVLDGKTLSRAEAHGDLHGLLEVEVQENGSTSAHLAVVQEIQRHLTTEAIWHIDFHEVKRGERALFKISVELVGEAKGVKMGGILEQHLRDLEIECLPKDLPEKITVDVSKLVLGEHLQVRDLALPEGVVVRTPASETVLTITEPSREIEPVEETKEAVVTSEVEPTTEEEKV